MCAGGCLQTGTASRRVGESGNSVLGSGSRPEALPCTVLCLHVSVVYVCHTCHMPRLGLCPPSFTGNPRAFMGRNSKATSYLRIYISKRLLTVKLSRTVSKTPSTHLPMCLPIHASTARSALCMCALTLPSASSSIAFFT